MPSIDANPASGASVVATAQVLYRRLVIFKGVSNFGPNPGVVTNSATTIRTETTVAVNSLRTVMFHLFLFPQYFRTDVTFLARNTLAWRPVFQMPPDSYANGGTGSYVDVATNDWLPFCAPLLLPVGVPSMFEVPCGGAERVAIEVFAPDDVLPADQGQDQILVSISAS
jgi:hypothetical protein